MSTFGREADRLAKQAREHAQRVAKQAIRLHDAVGFSIASLADQTLPDDVARRTALDALRIGRKAS